MAIIGIVLLYGCSEGNIKQQSLEDIAGNVIKEVSEPYSGSDAEEKLNQEEAKEDIAGEDSIQAKEKTV